MEKSLKSSPFSLNKFSLTSSHSAFEDMSIDFGENIFQENKNIEIITEEVKEEIEKEIKNKKRLNDLDANILGNVAPINKNSKIPLKQKLINFVKRKHYEIKNFDGFLSFLFPPFSKSKTIRASIVELKKLNKNTKALINTKIPYGEGKERYKELSDNIALACNIQTSLKKKIG
ncbi:hypothetical protein IKA92_05745 [bacterium]|nr:hypothetical protein [bacterium]